MKIASGELQMGPRFALPRYRSSIAGHVYQRLTDPLVVVLLLVIVCQISVGLLSRAHRSTGDELHQPFVSSATSAAQTDTTIRTVCLDSKLKYDVVLTTGRRQMLGATLASTLSALAASRALLPAASFHLVVRDATTSHLSLLHNLAHMPWVQVHIASSVIELNPNISSKATYYKALLAPDSSSPSQLPALILEDDIWLLDDFPTKLQQLVSSAASQAGGRDYLLSPYLPDFDVTLEPSRTRDAHRQQYIDRLHEEQQRQEQQQAEREAAQQQPGYVWLDWLLPRKQPAAKEIRMKQQEWQRAARDELERQARLPYSAVQRGYLWGTQAVWFSSGALRRDCAQFYSTYLGSDQGLQDIPLSRWANSKRPLQFYPDRSLVQHTGSSSTIWGAGRGNKKFHRANTFPFFEKWVTDDTTEDWI